MLIVACGVVRHKKIMGYAHGGGYGVVGEKSQPW